MRCDAKLVQGNMNKAEQFIPPTGRILSARSRN